VTGTPGYRILRMSLVDAGFSCTCGMHWNAPLLQSCPVDVFVAATQGVWCPRCGRGPRHLVVGPVHDQAACERAQSMPQPDSEERALIEVDLKRDRELEDAERRKEDDEYGE